MAIKSKMYPARVVMLTTLVIVLASFFVQALAPFILVNSALFQSIKVFTAIFCLATLIFWFFLRNTGSYLYRDNGYKLKRVALILLLQFFSGLGYFAFDQTQAWQFISMTNLVLVGATFVSLHWRFLTKRLSDAIVIFAVSSIFLGLISFILGVSGDFYSCKKCL